MNKLLIFPLAFMFILTIYGALYFAPTVTETLNYTPEGELIISNQTIYVDAPGEYDIFNIRAIHNVSLILLTIAIAASSIVGFKLFGTGLSEYTQRNIFISIFFTGIWASLTIFSAFYLFANEITSILWVTLTVMYGLGVALTVTREGDA